MCFDMPGAQPVEAFEKKLEAGNSLTLSLADPLMSEVVSPIGSILVWSESPEFIPLPIFEFSKCSLRNLLNYQEFSDRLLRVIFSEVLFLIQKEILVFAKKINKFWTPTGC